MKNIFKNIFRYFIILIDGFCMTLCYLSSYYFVKDDMFAVKYLSQEMYFILYCISIYILLFFVFRAYRRLWKYAKINDYISIVLACISSLIIICIISAVMKERIIPIEIQFLSCILILLYSVFSRTFLKLEYLLVKNGNNINSNNQKLLIIGAGQATEIVLTEIGNKQNPEYEVIGLIDDDIAKKGGILNGAKVLGNRHDIINICNQYKVDSILIAIPSMTETTKSDLLKICSMTSCTIKVLPQIDRIFSYNNLLYSARNIEMEDLLGRDPVILNDTEINKYISGNVVFVTGAGGSIGSEICRQVAKHNPKKIIIFDIYENSSYELENEFNSFYRDVEVEVCIGTVRDYERVFNLFKKHRPSVVFHAAAHKHVPLMEKSPQEAIKNNVIGTYNVARASVESGVEKFVLISTDKAVNPTNIMGATKRLCEMVIQAFDKERKTQFSAVRFGNVLGSNGSVIPVFKKQIATGGPVTVTHKEVTRFFMTIQEAVQLVLQAAVYARGGEIFVLDMGEPVNIYEMAENMIRLSGFKPHADIKIICTGLRQGEKLYEELLMAEEGLNRTLHHKIYIAQPSIITKEEIDKIIKRLEEVSKYEDEEKIKEYMATVVPTYKYNVQAQGE